MVWLEKIIVGVILQLKKSHIKEVFFAGLFASKTPKVNSRKKVHIPKNATESQRHNILMRDDPDYLVAFRAARRSADGIEDSRRHEEAVKRYRDGYYSEIKKRTEYGRYLKAKFSD